MVVWANLGARAAQGVAIELARIFIRDLADPPLCRGKIDVEAVQLPEESSPVDCHCTCEPVSDRFSEGVLCGSRWLGHLYPLHRQDLNLKSYS